MGFDSPICFSSCFLSRVSLLNITGFGCYSMRTFVRILDGGFGFYNSTVGTLFTTNAPPHTLYTVVEEFKIFRCNITHSNASLLALYAM